MDEKIGASGESVSNLLALLLPGGAATKLGAAGLTHGLTKTGASPLERIKSGAIEGGVGYGGSKALGALGRFLRPAKTGAALREGAVEAAAKTDKVIEGKNIVNAIKEWSTTVLKANPGKEKQINKVVESTKNLYGNSKLTPKEAQKIWFEIDSGFGQSGVKKTTIEASADRVLRDTFKTQIDKIAPGFKEGTEKIAKGLNIGKNVKKYGGQAAIGAATSAPIYYFLNKILNQDR